MTPEELMKPRYKVIADFYQNQKDKKDNQIKIGDLFMNYMPQQKIVWRRISNDKWEDVTIHCPEQYPHLFKPLQWWEERKESDMPEYVKDPHGVIKPAIFEMDDSGFWMNVGEREFAVVDKVMVFYEPATEAEYLAQNKALTP